MNELTDQDKVSELLSSNSRSSFDLGVTLLETDKDLSREFNKGIKSFLQWAVGKGFSDHRRRSSLAMNIENKDMNKILSFSHFSIKSNFPPHAAYYFKYCVSVTSVWILYKTGKDYTIIKNFPNLNSITFNVPQTDDYKLVTKSIVNLFKELDFCTDEIIKEFEEFDISLLSGWNTYGRGYKKPFAYKNNSLLFLTIEIIGLNIQIKLEVIDKN